MRQLLLLLFLAAVGSAGCMNAETHATEDQEKIFRNPNKEIPPDVYEKMMKNRAEAARKAAETRNTSSNPPVGGPP